MLDHIAFGTLLEQPARKDAIPFVVALILHAELDEGPGFRRVFPRRGPFAGAQANDRATHARGFAGLHLKLADQPVALVEEAEDRDALVHGGCPLDSADLLRNMLRLRKLRRRFAGALAVTSVAGGQSGRHDDRHQRDPGETEIHEFQSAPGRQAS